MNQFRFLSLAALAAGVILGCGCSGEANKDTGTTGKSDPAPTTGNPSTTAREMPTAEGNKVTGDKILIGVVASQNGELKPWGEDQVKGCQLAVDEVNKAGGIGGKQVQMLVGDSNSKPEQGKSASEKLISDGALAVVGEVASGITAQIEQAAFEKGIPVIAVGATRTDLTAKHGNVFRVCYTDAFQGPVMAKFAHDDLGLTKVALLTDTKQPYSVGLSKSFRDAFTAMGGEIVDEQSYESGQTQFSGQLTNLKAKNPDGLFMSGYFNETGPIARQAKEAGLDVKMLGGDGWDSNDILTSGGEAILGSYFCNHYNDGEDRPEVKDFLGKWQAKYKGRPGTTMGALGYDAMALTLDALKRASSMDSKALITAIDNTENFPGVSGVITLKGKNGDPTKRALIVKLEKGGQVFAKAYEQSEVLDANGKVIVKSGA